MEIYDGQSSPIKTEENIVIPEAPEIEDDNGPKAIDHPHVKRMLKRS